MKRKINPMHYCLDFFKKSKDIGSITFGLQTLKQFKEIINCWDAKIKYYPNNFDVSFSDQFLDPRKWPVS